MLQPLQKNWEFYHPRLKRWYSAVVPGSVHLDLQRHGLIDDPFWRTNEDVVAWVGEENWLYRCRFEANAEMLSEDAELVADGLDTLASISLNGKLVAKTESMFTGYRWSLKEKLRPGQNELRIQFQSPLPLIKKRFKTQQWREWVDPVGGSSQIRKQPSSFGWDWGPRLVACGIYKNIGIASGESKRIDQVKVRQFHKNGSVRLQLEPSIVGSRSGLTWRSTLSYQGEVVAYAEMEPLQVKAPKLWWPNGQGEQPLYHLSVELVQAGRVIDTWTRRIGLRTIELEQKKDRWGKSFQFKVNGRVIFAKGANWITAHAFANAVTDADYHDLLSSAQAAHMNMIRVWGGGIYEMEKFYDICDEKGLLVWQDFMFACSLYPGDKAFLALVKAEAEHQVKRLAHRACLALWCGNNELEQKAEEFLKTAKLRKAYDDVFYGVIPTAVKKFDGQTAYWPSSSHNPAGYDKGHNNEAAGDAHFWDVWHLRKPVNTYQQKQFRFCSEFGMQSYPSASLAETFCEPSDLNIFGPVMEKHQKNPAGNLIILDYMSRLFRFPKNFAALAFQSQLNQAWCMKVGIEHFRRSAPRTMGSLYWQLNDCWPVASWSSLEFKGGWKAMHYEAVRFHAPLAASVKLIGEEKTGFANDVVSTVQGAEIFTVSDIVGSTKASLRWELRHLDGRILRRGSKTATTRYLRPARQFNLRFEKELKQFGASKLLLRVMLFQGARRLSDQTTYFTAPRFMDFKAQDARVRVGQVAENEYWVEFKAAHFVPFQSFELAGSGLRASDNFFDLYPGEAKRVSVVPDKKMTLTQFKRNLRPMALTNTY